MSWPVSSPGDHATDGFDYELVRRPRHTLCIQIHEAGHIRVLAPLAASRGEIERLLARRRSWIERKLRETAARPVGVSIPPPAGSLLPFLGESLALELTAGLERAQRVGATLRVPAGDGERILAALKGWYRDEALRRALAMAPRYTPALRREPRRFIIREQKTRWGSCSRAGVISLNWRLLLGAPALFEYVLIHELCHLVHPHHGPRFWEEVARFLPDYASRRSALRRFPGSWFGVS
ncbi:MAG: M48 family metallopeptidase [Acidiferrobacteraceae bacterium]